jgi:hypothetical protein
MRAEKELAAQAAGTCVASPSGPKNPQAKGVAAQDAISTHMCHVSLIVPCPNSFERLGPPLGQRTRNRRNTLEKRMLREIVVQEQMPGNSSPGRRKRHSRERDGAGDSVSRL